MAEWSTIASLATAGGTLVLAIATFGSTRSANRAARASEEALMVGLRPVLFNARPEDPPQKVGFADNHWVRLRDGLGVVQLHDERIYLAMALRNVARGLAVIHGWHLVPDRVVGDAPAPPVEDFRRHTRDLYIPAGDVSFWQAAIREHDDPLYGPLRAAISDGPGVTIDVLYGDHEGGQRTITRFFMSPRTHADDDEPWMWMCVVARHWNIDRDDPR